MEIARAEARRVSEDFVEALGALCTPGKLDMQAARDAAGALAMSVGTLAGPKGLTMQQARAIAELLEAVVNTLILTAAQSGGRDPQVMTTWLPLGVFAADLDDDFDDGCVEVLFLQIFAAAADAGAAVNGGGGDCDSTPLEREAVPGPP